MNIFIFGIIFVIWCVLGLLGPFVYSKNGIHYTMILHFIIATFLPLILKLLKLI